MNGIYNLLSLSAADLRPDNWADESRPPLSQSQLAQAVIVAEDAEDSIREFSEGIIGLGGVLTTAGLSGEVTEYDVAQVGRLLKIAGETLVGLQFVQEEAKHFINESARRSSQLEAKRGEEL